jgi:hypothetical protein
MATVYENAEAVESIAQGFIPNYHPDLATAKFRYVFREKAGKKGGKTVLGTVKKAGDLIKFMTEFDYIMEVALDTWNELDETKRAALVDHLLERCYGEEDEDSGEMRWKTREPDVQEFTSILRRHGAWNEDLVNFVSVGQSIDLSYMTATTQQTVETTQGAPAN